MTTMTEPIIAGIEPAYSTIALPARAFRDMLEAAKLYALPLKDDGRASLRQVQFRFEKDEIVLATSDATILQELRFRHTAIGATTPFDSAAFHIYTLLDVLKEFEVGKLKSDRRKVWLRLFEAENDERDADGYLLDPDAYVPARLELYLDGHSVDEPIARFNELGGKFPDVERLIDGQHRDLARIEEKAMYPSEGKEGVYTERRAAFSAKLLERAIRAAKRLDSEANIRFFFGDTGPTRLEYKAELDGVNVYATSLVMPMFVQW